MGLLKVNFDRGRGGNKALFVVVHIIGTPGITAESAIQHFSNPNNEVSAHYIVKKNGTVINLVDENNTAWANGQIGNNLPKSPIAKMWYQKNVSLNSVSISIENEGSEYVDIPDVQYKANAELIKDICVRWQIPIDRLHIIKHSEIKDTKVCPGKIDVDRIVSLASAVKPIQPDIPTPVLTPSTDEVNKRISILQALLATYQKLLALLQYRRTLGAARSTAWPAVRRTHLASNPVCAVCGAKGRLLKPLNAHHKIPFNLNKALELDLNNLITLCRIHHLDVGHLGSFYSFNKDVDLDAKFWFTRRANRP